MMDYVRDLKSLVQWVKERPGNSVAALEKEIKRVPYPERGEAHIPSADCIQWKLRYLNALGYFYEDRGRWYPAPDLEEKLHAREEEERRLGKEVCDPPATNDIQCLELSLRVGNRIKKQGVTTVADLRSRIESDTLDKTGLGEKSLVEIKRALDWHSEKSSDQD